MKLETIRKTLSEDNLGKWTAPLAPAIFWGWAVYQAAMAINIIQPLAVIGAIGFALAIEIVGMVSGKNAIRFTVAGHWLAIPSWVSLAMYTGIGMYELRDSIFRFAFLFSFLAYVNSGVSAIWERNAQAKLDTTAERKLTQVEQLAAERADKQAEAERAQQLKLAQLAAQKEVQLAKVQAASQRQDGGDLPQEKRQEASGKVSWRTMPPEERLAIARATPAQLAEKYPHIAERTIRKWRQDSAQLAATMPHNSPYVAEQGASGD